MLFQNGVHQLTVVSGSTYTGATAADGSWNIVLDDTTHTGLYHPCGARRVTWGGDGSVAYAPDGSVYLNWLLNAQKSYVALDFMKSKYYGGSLSSMLSVSNSGGYAQKADGTWISFGSNTPRITDQGMLIEEARTNKNTNFNANPVDATNVTPATNITVTVVDDTAALVAAGLQNICTSGKVYKVVNTDTTTSRRVTPAGVSGNLNTHFASTWVRVTAGSVSLGRSNDAAAIGSSTSSSTYTRIGGTFTPLTVNDSYGLFLQPLSTCYFILNQMEEGTFITSPIAVAGATATRNADVPQLIGPAASAALGAKSAFVTVGKINSPSTSSQPGRVWGTSGAAAQAPIALSNNAPTVIRAQSWNGTVNLNSSNTFDFSTTFGKIALSGDSSGRKITLAGTATSDTNPLVITGNQYIGNDNTGVRSINGYMQRFALSPVKGTYDNLTA